MHAGRGQPVQRILVADPNIPKVTRFPTFIEVDREGQFFYQGAGDPAQHRQTRRIGCGDQRNHRGLRRGRAREVEQLFVAMDERSAGRPTSWSTMPARARGP